MNAASGTNPRGQESPPPDAPRAYRWADPAMAARPAMHAARRVQRSRAADGDKPSPTLRFLFLFIFNRSRYEKSESSAPQCYPRIGDMQTPPKSRSPSAFHAFLHIAQRGVPFITMGAQTFDYHTSGGVRRIGLFASQNLPPSPQPQAENGLNNPREITPPPASDAFLGSLKLPTSPPLPPRHHKTKTQISGPGTVTFDSPAHTMTHILNPNTVPPIPAGQNQTFTVLATDAAGTPVPNAPVALMIGGAHSLQLNGITGADGQISFNYAGANPGTDTVQALGTVTGMFALSNQVTVTWGTPTPTPPSTPPPGL